MYRNLCVCVYKGFCREMPDFRRVSRADYAEITSVYKGFGGERLNDMDLDRYKILNKNFLRNLRAKVLAKYFTYLEAKYLARNDFPSLFPSLPGAGELSGGSSADPSARAATAPAETARRRVIGRGLLGAG